MFAALNQTLPLLDTGHLHSSTLPTEMLSLIIMLSLFSILGSIGNSLATFVFFNVRDKSTAQIFILTMSIIDLFTCLVIIPFTIVVEYLRYDVRYDFVCKLYQFLITSKVPLSAFLMVAIAFDRYFCICHPLRRIVTPQKMKIVIACLVTFACTLGVITSMYYGVYRYASIPSFLDSAHVEESPNELIDWRPIVNEPVQSDDVSNVVLTKIFNYFKNRNESRIVTSMHDADRLVYIGKCIPNSLILDFKFLYVYQKIYSFLFVVCLVLVAILYELIFRFIQLRRSKKLNQRLVLCTYINREHAIEGTRMTNVNMEHDDNGYKSKESVCDETQTLKLPEETQTLKVPEEAHTLKVADTNTERRRASSFAFDAEKLIEDTRAANIKTALMLFTVTLVFTIAFLPAWLMAHKYVPTNIVVFYMYFSYNVINPCIYAFMNPVFQEQLKKLCRRYREEY